MNGIHGVRPVSIRGIFETLRWQSIFFSSTGLNLPPSVQVHAQKPFLILQPQSQTWISYSSLGELKLWAEDSWIGHSGELRLELMAAFRLLKHLACSGTHTTKCCFFCTKHGGAATLTEWLEPSFVMWEMMKLLILLFA